MSEKKTTSRREFLQASGTAAAIVSAATIVPSSVLGRAFGHTAPSDKLNVAAIGTGGMGSGNTDRCAKTDNIYALCDVDWDRAAGQFKKYPHAKQYKDFREMLEKETAIDACIVACPDHTHAVAAMAAMKLKKHVYVQKPLTHSVYEARILTETARKYGVATQMGNQGHSGPGCRNIKDWITAGVIGKVELLECWTNRPIWPQGITTRPPAEPVPDTLAWDLWIGPAKFRDYNHAYHPQSWRAYKDFGTGALGDMACHIMDSGFFSLDLKYPSSVEGCTSRDIGTVEGGKWGGPVKNDETYPRSSLITYKFPARGNNPPCTVKWYDGGLVPVKPDLMDPNEKLPTSGSIFHGEKGIIICNEYGVNPVVYPLEAAERAKAAPQTVERIKDGEEGHETNWLEACKGGKPASSNFDYSGPLTEMVLMGNLATIFPMQKLMWDGPNYRYTNLEEANDWINPPYREGWSL